MPDTLRRRLLLSAPLALAAWVAFVVAWTWARRAGYPYDLEWMEGGVLTHAWRMQQGLPVYTSPTADFVPMIYPPGYYAVLAALGAGPGLSPLLGRLVSIAGTLAACGALVWGAWHHLRAWVPGVIAAALYLGTYDATGAFQDLVRPDALALGLLGWSIVLAPSRVPRAPEIAGVLLFLAFVVKHNSAAFGVPMALGLWAWHGGSVALRFAAVAAAPGLMFTGVMQLITDGGFLAYVVSVPASHPIKWERVFPGTPGELGQAMPISCVALAVLAIAQGPTLAPRLPIPAHVIPAVAAAAAGVILAAGGRGVDGIGATGIVLVGAGGVSALVALVAQALRRSIDGPWLYGVATIATALFTAGLMRGHHGGFVNVFMPVCWVLAAGSAYAFYAAMRDAPRDNGTALAAVAFSVQLAGAAAAVDYARFVPTEADLTAGDAIVARLREVDGEVLSPFAAWMPVLAGKQPSQHLIAIWDVGHNGSPYADGTEPLRQAIEAHRWGAILDGSDAMGYGARKAYRAAETFAMDESALRPKTGWRAKPAVLLLPNTARRARAGGPASDLPREPPIDAADP